MFFHCLSNWKQWSWKWYPKVMYLSRVNAVNMHVGKELMIAQHFVGFFCISGKKCTQRLNANCGKGATRRWSDFWRQYKKFRRLTKRTGIDSGWKPQLENEKCEACLWEVEHALSRLVRSIPDCQMSIYLWHQNKNRFQEESKSCCKWEWEWERDSSISSTTEKRVTWISNSPWIVPINIIAGQKYRLGTLIIIRKVLYRLNSIQVVFQSHPSENGLLMRANAIFGIVVIPSLMISTEFMYHWLWFLSFMCCVRGHQWLCQFERIFLSVNSNKLFKMKSTTPYSEYIVVVPLLKWVEIQVKNENSLQFA